MDFDNVNEIKFDNHKKSCRMCMKPLGATRKCVGISKTIQNRFKAVTSEMELRLTSDFSRKICFKCDQWLKQTFSSISKLKAIQEKLYSHVDKNSSSRRAEKVLVKSEVDDQSENEIQSNSFNNSFQPSIAHLFDSFEFLKLNQLKNETLMGDSPQPHVDKSTDDFDVADDFDDFEDFTQNQMKNSKTTRKSNEAKPKKSTNKKDLKEICQECGIMLSSKTALKNHFACKHGDKVKRFFCDLCDYSGTIKYHLHCHMKSHISVDIRRIHKCTQCDFVGMTKQSLRIHGQAEHSGVIHTCHCGREFKHKNAMKLHSQRVHDGRKPHVCHCGKGYFTKKELEAHRKCIHEPFKKDYSCDFCGAQFCTTKQLTRHRAYYHLAKLACTYKDCDKSYVSKSLLQRHLNTHIGNRDQICHLCEKSYFSQRDLQRHLDVTHKQTTYFCELCSYTNSRKDYLGNHLKSAHNLNAEERSEILKTVKFIKNAV